MATYAIGDLHGCFPELKALLNKIDFKPDHDRLWFVGDLISRGPDSLGCLRFVRDLGDRAVVVMGNHEVRAIAGLSGCGTLEFDSYMGFLANAWDRDELYAWMRSLPLVHRDLELGFSMVHAGLYPNWSVADALAISARLGEIFSDVELTGQFFSQHLKPANEQPEAVDSWEWLAFALGVMTKIRHCTRDGRLISPKMVRESGLLGPDGKPAKDSPYQAWYEQRSWLPGEKLVHGHWAMAGLTINSHCFGLDSGAVYGGHLTAMRLDHPDHPITQVDSKPYIVVENVVHHGQEK
jgi:bis(5'-nucleosyl)-tetraphosphatase (symmetrical)